MTKVPDLEERKKALDISSHFHVESPAGAGKTGLIIERILRLLSGVSNPSEILAMTFTRKAAAEMKGRILEILRAAAENEKTGDEYTDSLIEKGKKAISRYSGLRREMLLSGADLQITTIHGFCLQVCTRAPLESGLEPGLVLVDEREQERLQEIAAREVINDLLSRPQNDPARSALESRLLMHNMDVKALIAEISSLLAKRDQLGDLLSVLGTGEDSDQFLEKFQENITEIVRMQLRRLEEIITESEIGKRWDDFIDYLSEHDAKCLENVPRECPSAHWKDLSHWQRLSDIFLTNNGKIRRSWGPRHGGLPAGFSKTTWKSAIMNLGDEFVEYLNEIRRYPDLEKFADEVEAVEDLILVVWAALKMYRKICRSKGVIDYVDLELGALKALGSVESVTDSLLFWDRSIKHILIDEFQDTSSTEYRIIQRLLGGWESGDGRTLFLVGDPKQSIYRFRKADVSIFYKAEKGIERDGLEPIKPVPVKLRTNFRSSSGLISWVNSLFGKTVMSRPRIEYEEVRFIDAIPACDNDGSRCIPELALFVKQEDESGNRVRRREATYLARKVEERLAILEPGETIGVLVFTRTHLACYLEAFKEAGIPLQVKDGLKLAEIPEVAHLANLARAIVRPHDQLSWIACLRSPWLMLPVSLIKDILEAEGNTIFQKLKDFESEHENIRIFRTAMARTRSRIGRDQLSKVVRKAWTDLKGPEKVASISGLAGVNACLKFLDHLRDCEGGSPEETLAQIDFLLESLYDPQDITTADSPVFLMTVHGAKGLEFDHCFIPWMDYQLLQSGRGEKPAYLSVSLEGVPVVASRPDKRVKRENCVYDFLFEIEKRKTMAEARRLFYVAVTRAKKSLFMSGVWSGKKLPNGPLGWVLDHIGIKKLSEDVGDGEYRGTQVYINPESVKIGGVKQRRGIDRIPVPKDFFPEPVPFKIRNPSNLPYLDDHGDDLGAYDKLLSTARGIVIHKIIEQLSHGMDLPGAGYLEQLLLMQGLNNKMAKGVAREILDELRRCCEEPFFKWITGNDFQWSASELGIESMAEKNVITSGVIDRVVFDGKKYWIVDYKTHQPGTNETKGDFIERMKGKFKPQLVEYRRLLASAKGISDHHIHTIIYLTHIPTWIEV